jgi:hypothetical protein
MSLKGKVIDMASEKEANLARAQHSDFIRGLGAHSIGVDECKHQGESGFAVIAFFDRKPSKKIPPTLKVKSGKRTLDVPLEVEIMKMPSAE